MRERLAAVVAVLAAVGVTAGCGAVGVGGQVSVADKETLVIGVNTDQPGVGARKAGGEFEGFDIDVARTIADRLGAEVTFRPVQSATRERLLQSDEVDLVVASYSITQERKTKVAFAGPYYVAHQDILVRKSDAAAIGDVRDLARKRLCQVKGSVSYGRVADEREVGVRPVASPGYTDCVRMLAAGALDAVSTDDLILAGLAAGTGAGSLAMVNAPISDEPYGVGIARGDLDGCAAVNQVITQMYQDGTAARLLTKWFGPVGLDVTTTVPQFEGCD